MKIINSCCSQVALIKYLSSPPWVFECGEGAERTRHKIDWAWERDPMLHFFEKHPTPPHASPHFRDSDITYCVKWWWKKRWRVRWVTNKYEWVGKNIRFSVEAIFEWPLSYWLLLRVSGKKGKGAQTFVIKNRRGGVFSFFVDQTNKRARIYRKAQWDLSIITHFLI